MVECEENNLNVVIDWSISYSYNYLRLHLRHCRTIFRHFV